MREWFSFDLGPFCVRVGWDSTLGTFFGDVFEAAFPDEPTLSVGCLYRELTTIARLRAALTDGTFDFGREIPLPVAEDLQHLRSRSLREPNVADGAELH